ncbi:putative metalloprotease CJM1_0395 family protein, partial [Methylogaea oryzae]
ASFSYERGPDGQQYAVGGEVSIDTSPVPNDPEATARKAEQIRRAALAPANPSGQDISVAAAASQMQAQAQAEAAMTRQKPEGKADAYAASIDGNVLGARIDVTA